jgi:hypothetical protein
MNTTKSRNRILAVCLPAFLFTLPHQSLGAIVLLIDVSDPANVTFTATANNSAVAGNLSADFNGGITLKDFFTSNENIGVGDPLAISGTWISRGASSSFNEAVTFDFDANTGNVEPGVDLSLYHNVVNPSNLQQFITSAPPFTGSSTADLSLLTFLPNPGATGSVYMGYLGSHGGILGEWMAVAVPEPSAVAVVTGQVLLLTGLALRLHRKKTAVA